MAPSILIIGHFMHGCTTMTTKRRQPIEIRRRFTWLHVPWNRNDIVRLTNIVCLCPRSYCHMDKYNQLPFTLYTMCAVKQYYHNIYIYTNIYIYIYILLINILKIRITLSRLKIFFTKISWSISKILKVLIDMFINIKVRRKLHSKNSGIKACLCVRICDWVRIV